MWRFRPEPFRVYEAPASGALVGWGRTDSGVSRIPKSPACPVRAAAPRAKIEPMRYTYLGPSGTFTESALLSVPGAVGAERIPATSVPNALERLRSGDVDAAMVPIENSVEGGVSATLDAIAASEGMRIIREVLVPIRFVLVASTRD